MRHSSEQLNNADAQEKGRIADLILQARPSIYSASLAQQRLWFLHQLQGRSGAYNVHLGLWLIGSLDVAALHASVRELVKRHDSFRTAFRLDQGKLQQVVENTCNVEMPITDVSSAADPTAEAYRLAGREVEIPFDLSTAPLHHA